MTLYRRLHAVTAIPLLALALSSCASGITGRLYGAASAAPLSQNPVSITDHGVSSDLNGFMPNAVAMKTPTQTFCRDFEFTLVDGRIYYKSRIADGKVRKWKLLTKTGLPNSREREFRPPRRIVEISADADTLLAFSDEGRMYQCYFERTTVTKPYVWIDSFGWPDKFPLIQNDLVLGNRSWAVGTRRKDVLWYEDANGNQHHFGTMGIETIYFLTGNGQEIRYADTGLPSDFSHSILGPERGSFVARSLSASASTVFVINDGGEMYTRLADFDTLGNDPMFYKYTYERESYPIPGSDYLSNLTPWALPAEDWKKEPPIPRSGKARLTSRITILQTGQGNAARELRVAGLSPDGDVGYYHKAIEESSWSFDAFPLVLTEGDFLAEAATSPESGTGGQDAIRGSRKEFAYQGSLWRDGVKDPRLAFRVPDFPMSEGSCHLVVGYGDEERTIVLYPVEMWSYLQRYNPGLDGTQKNFFVTISIPEAALTGITPGFAALLGELFHGKDLALFSCRAEATAAYFQLDLGASGAKSVFLTRDGIPDIDPNLIRKAAIGSDAITGQYLDASLVLTDTDSLTILRRTEIERTIKANVEYRALLKNEIARFRAYQGVSGLSRIGYGAFDLVATVTLLDRLDFPKFSTATRFSGDIMTANASGYGFMAESREWVYSKVLELLDLRVREYESIIAAFDAGEVSARLNPSLRNTFPEYFALIGIPERLDGIAPADGGRPATARVLTTSPLFPGIVLDDGTSRALIELKDSARAILSRKGESLSRKPFAVAVAFHPFSGPSSVNAEGILSSPTGRLDWDGRTLRIWRDTSPVSQRLVFEGSVE